MTAWSSIIITVRFVEATFINNWRKKKKENPHTTKRSIGLESTSWTSCTIQSLFGIWTSVWCGLYCFFSSSVAVNIAIVLFFLLFFFFMLLLLFCWFLDCCAKSLWNCPAFSSSAKQTEYVLFIFNFWVRSHTIQETEWTENEKSTHTQHIFCFHRHHLR